MKDLNKYLNEDNYVNESSNTDKFTKMIANDERFTKNISMIKTTDPDFYKVIKDLCKLVDNNTDTYHDLSIDDINNFLDKQSLINEYKLMNLIVNVCDVFKKSTYNPFKRLVYSTLKKYFEERLANPMYSAVLDVIQKKNQDAGMPDLHNQLLGY
jgi:hypothetical protein